MKIAIVGSKRISTRENLDIVMKYMKSLRMGTEILTGDGPGVNRFVLESYPKRRRFEVRKYVPNWKQFGVDAVDIMNKRMIEEAKVVAVFWDGVSPGAKSIIDYCKRQKKDLEVIELKREG